MKPINMGDAEEVQRAIGKPSGIATKTSLEEKSTLLER